LRDEVWIAVVEHQIVDQWDLARHDASVVCAVDPSEFGSAAEAEYQDRGYQKRWVNSSLKVVK
jgi:hypothetical protein